MASRVASVLVVDDDPQVARTHAEMLENNGYRVIVQTSPEKVEEELEKAPEIEVVLLDIQMPGIDGTELLRRIKLQRPNMGVIMATVINDIEAAVSSTKAGAYNYLIKPLQEERLTRVFESYLNNRPVQISEDPRFSSFITRSPRFEEIFRRVKSFAEAEVTVLIQGETGTGKELIAQLIHSLSPRKKGTFTAINVAALSPDLFEAELFGHSKGAFTGASLDRAGYFEQAASGTLFLDEFGELRLELQKKLLRVIQTRRFCRVGETRERELNCRLVIATNRNLEEEVRNGQFRSDLYYRMSGHTIFLPPLRDRREDIEALALFFFEKYCSQYGRRLDGFLPETLEVLNDYSYPGNVRELEGIISAAVLLEQNRFVTPSSLPEHLLFPVDDLEDGTIESARYRKVMESLARHDGNQTRAAEELGIARGTLNRWLKEYRDSRKK